MEHQWKVGEWYKTRGGYEAQVLDVNYNGFLIIGKIKVDGREESVVWHSDGSYYVEKFHQYDLIPPVKREELWVNVYDGYVDVWSEKDEAEEYAASARIGLAKITIQGNDFTVEKVTV